MQYTEPYIPDAVEAAHDDGVDRVIGLPIFPLCGPSTTVISLDEVEESIAEAGLDVPFQAITGWHKHPDYNHLRARNAERFAEEAGVDLHDPETAVVFSAHGTPTHYLDEGSRYGIYVDEYTDVMASLLGLDDYHVGFRNHENRDIPWTEPEVEELVVGLDAERVVVEPVSFLHEQSETLSELMELEAETGSMLAAFRRRLGASDRAPPATLDDGLQALPRALAARYDDAVRLGEPVTDLAAVGSAASSPADGARVADGDGRYLVTTDRDEYRADAVVVTTPADVAGDLLDGVADGGDGLRELTYNPLGLVYLTADDVPAGALGYQVSYDADLRTLGVSFNGETFGRDGLCTAFLGGMHDPEVLAADDDGLGGIARRELERALDTEASVVGVERRDRWFPAYDRTWWALEELSTPPGLHLATNYTARMGITSRVREAERVAERIAG